MRTLSLLPNALSEQNSDSTTELDFEPTAFEDPLKKLNKFRESDEGKAFVTWARGAVEQARSDRNQHRNQWLQNYLFYRNRQSQRPLAGLSPATAKILGEKDKKSQRVINRIQPMIRTEIAAITAQKPSATVVPSSSENEDMFAAQAGEAVYQSAYDRLDVHSHFTIQTMWQVVAGTGFLKVWWDPNKIDIDSGAMGDMDMCAPSPFHIYIPDLLEPDIQRQMWVAHSYSKPKEWIDQVYAMELNGLVAKPTTVGSKDDFDSAMSEVEKTPTAPNSYKVIEMWLKRGAHKLFPNGGLVTLIEDVPVQVDQAGIPYEHGDFPFQKSTHIETGTFYGESPVTPLIELQVDYNKIRTIVRESLIKMSRLQILAPKGSVVASKWTNETGLVVEYRPGLAPPTPFPVQELPGYLFNELEQILRDMEDISGQHQVTKGQAPGQGVTAATAISYLQEKDDAYRTPAYHSVENMFKYFGRQVLSLAKQYWVYPRMVKIVGSDSAFDVQILKGSQLAKGTDLRIEPGSSLPTSKAAKQALIMDLMSQGFIPPEQGLKMMEIGGTNAVVDQLRIDERQAQRENLRLKMLTEDDIAMFDQQWQQLVEQGDPRTIGTDSQAPLAPPPVMPVNTYDNHEVHILVHDTFRKSQGFEQLPEAVKIKFQEHVEQHKQAMQQQMVGQFMDSIPGDGSEEGAFDMAGAEAEFEQFAAQAGLEQEPGMGDTSGGEMTGIPPEMGQEVV